MGVAMVHETVDVELHNYIYITQVSTSSPLLPPTRVATD